MKKTHNKTVSDSELKRFGFSVGTVFALIGVYPMFFDNPARIWAAIIAASLIFPAIIFPRLLMLPFCFWRAIGTFLGWLNTRIILSVLYFCALVPVSLFLKLTGFDPLRLEFDKSADSYREPPEDKNGTNLTEQH